MTPPGAAACRAAAAAAAAAAATAASAGTDPPLDKTRSISSTLVAFAKLHEPGRPSGCILPSLGRHPAGTLVWLRLPAARRRLHPPSPRHTARVEAAVRRLCTSALNIVTKFVARVLREAVDRHVALAAKI